MLSEDQVTHIANLANLDLEESQVPQFQKWLSEVLDYFEILDKVDTSQVEPTFQTTGLMSVWREEDKAGETTTLSSSEALSNATQQDGKYFVTEKVL